MTPARKATIRAGSCSAFYQPDIAGARTLAGVLRSELDPLSFAQQFKNSSPHRAAVEEVFDAALIANEAEAFVDEESCDSPARHTRSPPFDPRGNPMGCPAGGNSSKLANIRGVRRPASLLSPVELETAPV